MYYYGGLARNLHSGIIYTAQKDMIDWSYCNSRCGESIDANVGKTMPSAEGVDLCASNCIIRFNIPDGATFIITWNNPDNENNCSGVLIYQNVNGSAERYVFP